uniref:DNA repair nuclease/redox regulator APEX1 n=1 Tax=Myxobolus squamalis TaxID=59785 RepID=A0A6B2G681_MYXSQ
MAGFRNIRLDYRRKWNNQFKEYLTSLDKLKPVFLCGDLNVAHHPIDLTHPTKNLRSAGFTIEERNDFTDLLSSGFIDSYRHLYPEKTESYTYWSYRSNARANNTGWRLDYFVISKRKIDSVVNCVIRPDVTGSDHCPVVLFTNN